MSKRANKSVSFALDDEFEKDLKDYAEKKGVFSKYVKRLIMLDKMGVIPSSIPKATPTIQHVVPEPSGNDKMKHMF